MKNNKSSKYFYSTKRLDLVAATLAHLDAELESNDKLAGLLNVVVTPEWPPGEYDRSLIEYFRGMMLEREEELTGWLGWYAIKRKTDEEPAVLVAAGGYCGSPSEKGEVEIGYSVTPANQRKGYATEIVNALVEIAREDSRVKRIIGRTTDANKPSKIVLERNGFHLIGSANDEGLILYELNVDKA